MCVMVFIVSPGVELLESDHAATALASASAIMKVGRYFPCEGSAHVMSRCVASPTAQAKPNSSQGTESGEALETWCPQGQRVVCDARLMTSSLAMTSGLVI